MPARPRRNRAAACAELRLSRTDVAARRGHDQAAGEDHRRQDPTHELDDDRPRSRAHLAPPAERREHLLIEVLREARPRRIEREQGERAQRHRSPLAPERGPRAPGTGDQPEHDRSGQRKQADRSFRQHGGHDAQAGARFPSAADAAGRAATAASTAAATAAVVSSDTLVSSRLPTIAHETTGTRIQNRIGSQSKSDAQTRRSRRELRTSGLAA